MGDEVEVPPLLAELYEQPFSKDHMTVAEAAFAKDADPRVVAILGVAYIDDMITREICDALPGLNSDLRSKLFSGYGSLASLAPKLDLARAMGLITSDGHTLLFGLKRVRDRFAHNLRLSSFDDPEIAHVLDNLPETVGPLKGQTRRDYYCNMIVAAGGFFHGLATERFIEKHHESERPASPSK